MASGIDPNKEQTAILSSQKILQMHYLYFNDQQVYMCRNTLLNKVMENGIVVCSNKKECKEMEIEEHELHNVWIPFAKDIIDVIMMIGIVPVRFDGKTPYIPKAGSYNIHVITSNTGKCRFEMHDRDNPNDPVPGSIVLSGYGMDPRSNASLTSMMQTLEPTMLFTHRLKDAALSAEEIRCNPPVLVERREKGTDAREGLDFDFYMDSDTLKTNLNAQYNRDEKGIKQLERQRFLFANAINGVENSSKKNTTNAMNNIVPLPNEYHVGSMIEPSGRNDLVMLCRMASENICSILGVPRSMMISDNVVRGDVDGSHDVFKRSCMMWKQILGSILTAVYRNTNVVEETDRLKKLSKKRKMNDKNSKIKNFINKEMVQLIVPVTPYISNEELKDLYLHQIIDWSTYKEYVLRNASLPSDLLKAKEKDPWSTDDKKELLGISQKPEAISEGGAMKKQKTSSGSSSMSSGSSSSKPIAKGK